MYNNFLEKLEEVYNSVNFTYKEFNVPNDLINSFFIQMNKYNELEKEFFIGKKEDIKNFYSELKEKSYKYNDIGIIDLNRAIELYKEYYDDLLLFINKLLEVRVDPDREKIDVNKKIKYISENFKNVLFSIFGGEDNVVETVDLLTAMETLESIIIFKEFKSHISELDINIENIESKETINHYFNDYMEVTSILVKSLNSFFYEYYKSLFETYDKIEETLNGKTRAITEIEAHEGKNKYKIY